MKLLPAPACNFVISPAPEYPVIETRRFCFWYDRDRREAGRHLIGSFNGNPMKDPVFHRKIKRIEALLTIKGIPFHYDNYNLYEHELAEARRLSQEEKRARKHTKLLNAYNRRKEEINSSADLFKGDKLIELDKELETALAKLSTMYLL